MKDVVLEKEFGSDEVTAKRWSKYQPHRLRGLSISTRQRCLNSISYTSALLGAAAHFMHLASIRILRAISRSSCIASAYLHSMILTCTYDNILWEVG